MIPEIGFFLLGISGFLVLYMVLAHLSARMGEGLLLPGYYRLYYIAILIMVMAGLYGSSQYAGENDSEDILFILLIIGNALAVAASYKYWWWLKDELWITKDKGEE